MTIEPSLLRAIEAAVAEAGGTADDAQDLIDVWSRLQRVQGPRVDRMRRVARMAPCSCVDGGDELSPDGRCARCSGVLR